MAHMNRPIRRREWRTVGLSTSTRHNNRKNFRVGDGNHIQPSSNRKKQSILSKSNRNNRRSSNRRRGTNKSFHDTTFRNASTNTRPMMEVSPARRAPSSWLPPKKKQESFTYRINAFDGSITTMANGFTKRNRSFKKPLANKTWVPITWVDEDELRRQEEARARIQRKLLEAQQQQKNNSKDTIKSSIYRVKKLSTHCCPTTLYAQRMRRREKLGLGLM
jgi:hypothetical protein